MRTLITFALVAVLSGSLFAQKTYNWGNNGRNQIVGSGNVISEDRKVTDDFTEISSCCAIEVELTQARQASIRVEADDNILPYVETDISGGELEIRIASKMGIKTKKTIRVYVSMPELTAIQANSATNISTTNTFSGDDLEIDCSSAAQVDVNFDGDEVEVEVSSAGSVDVEGNSQRLELEASSAGQIDAQDCASRTVRADANSAGSIWLQVSDELNANANSGGSIRYKGSPDKLYTDADSGGKIRKI